MWAISMIFLLPVPLNIGVHRPGRSSRACRRGDRRRCGVQDLHRAAELLEPSATRSAIWFRPSRSLLPDSMLTRSRSVSSSGCCSFCASAWTSVIGSACANVAAHASQSDAIKGASDGAGSDRDMRGGPSVGGWPGMPVFAVLVTRAGARVMNRRGGT